MTSPQILPIAWLIAFFLALCGAGVAAGERPEIHPSSKYPDFPFSEAVSYAGVLYLSGDIGTDASGRLVEGGIGPETRQTMENIKATLGRHGLGMSDIVKCTVFLADIAEWPTFNTIYAQYFNAPYPARSALGVNGLAGGARLEVECIAAYPDRPPMPMDRASTQPGS